MVTKKRILVVDDHPLTRKGLCDAIEAQADLMVCGEAEAWRQALKLVQSLHPDIVLLDLNLTDGNGWDLLRQLEAEGIHTPVLVVSVCAEEVYAPRLLQSGAKGYLMKDTPITKVMEAIRKILGGHIAVSDTMASHLIQTATQRSGKAYSASELDQLSNRELQVFELLRQGKSSRYIAECMGVSQKTIGTYKARLMEKCGVRTTPELLARMQVPAADPPACG
jgi:DNA-binding NarL/FixJ family response regulator